MSSISGLAHVEEDAVGGLGLDVHGKVGDELHCGLEGDGHDGLDRGEVRVGHRVFCKTKYFYYGKLFTRQLVMV